MGLRLYTQPRCNFCVVMNDMLKEAGYSCILIDISEDPSGLAFMKEKGHKTVPQLYWNGAWINQDKTTYDLTPMLLMDLIERAVESERSAGFNGA